MQEVYSYFLKMPVLIILELALIYYLAIAVYKDFLKPKPNTKTPKGLEMGATLGVERGANSMGFFYFILAPFATAYVGIIQVSDVGCKDVLIAVNMVALFYLCLGSAWTRNEILLRWLRHISKD